MESKKKHTPENLSKHIRELASSTMIPKPEQVLVSILMHLHPINLVESGEIEPGERITQKKMHIITIDEILRIASNIHLGICKRFNNIYVYNGAFWKLIDTSEMKLFLRDAAITIGIHPMVAKHYAFVEEMYKQLLLTATIPYLTHGSKTLINLKNGTLEFSNGKCKLREFRAADFLTYQLDFCYSPDEIPEKFNKYLQEVLPETSSQHVLSEYIGYIFIKNDVLKLEKALLLYGDGANGKSVFFEIINALLGSDNMSSYSIQNLTNENGYYRVKIANKLLNYASELSTSLNTTIFKQLVSGEPIEARSPFQEPVLITDYAKLLFNVNELPKDIENNHAYFRRLLIIPFKQTIPDDKQDKQLAIKIIKDELPGILNWVLKGLERLMIQKNFSPCMESDVEIESYKLESDSVKMFLSDYNYQKTESNPISLRTLYLQYQQFCNEDGYRFLGKKNFTRRLKREGITLRKQSMGMMVYVDIEKIN